MKKVENAVRKDISETEGASDGHGQRPLSEILKSRESNEIVIAFAGPIGAGIRSVINQTNDSLKAMGYEKVIHIRLSNFLQEKIQNGMLKDWKSEAENSDPFKRYRRLQNAGRELRERTGNMQILAEYAVERIVVARGESHPGDDFGTKRYAYLIDQVKRPEEVELLRALYRNLFYLIGVTKPYKQRQKSLEDEGLSSNETEELMDIDRNEDGSGGQRLEKTLHLADFFVRNDLNLSHRDSITRFIRLIHGDKSKTPDRMEIGMYAAYAAGLRSACLSRQVGAAITNDAGEIIATGCNDVPAPEGGLYSSGSKIDDRCINKEGAICFNDREKRNLQEDIGKIVRKNIGELNPGGSLDESWLQTMLESIYRDTRLSGLIEFSRSVHAEMDAIVSLARTGGVGIKHCTLYSTTFPCHSCARHIVAAGIKEVYYIEPYEKSMAEALHSDAIEFEEPRDVTNAESVKSDIRRVKFLHFEGVAPRIFAFVFRADGRKDRASGKFISIIESKSSKILPEYLDKYRDFEAAAIKHLGDIIEGLK